jgi:predicted RNase H-like HicB family nuclease
MPVLASVKPNHSVIEPDKDGVFVEEYPTLSGCAAQDKTRAEILVNINDAVAG